MSAETDDLLTGAFGEYSIQRVLGQGGMATVYLAQHPKMGNVALKVLHRHLVKKPEVLHRFWREMRLSDKLDHPSIVRTRDAGVEGERFYVAMDFMEGVSLYEFERSHGKIAPKDAIKLALQILTGLEHAHAAGVIHRDLKPENILLDAAGNAHVSDFGIAKHMEASVMLTRTGTAMGTPYYMAPEQVKNAKSVKESADIYSLGILMYEMVTGSVPFYAKDPMEVVRFHIQVAPVRPSGLEPSIPRELELVILKAMEKKPEDRFQTARHMKKALEVVERGERTGIKLKSPVREAAGSGGGGGFGLLVVAGLIGAMYVIDPSFFHELAAKAQAALATPAPAGATAGGASGAVPPSPSPMLPPHPRDLPELIAKGEWLRARKAAGLAGTAGAAKHEKAWGEKVRSLTQAKQFGPALEGAEAMMKAFPSSADAPFLAGDAALGGGKPSRAAELISEAFRIADAQKLDALFARARDTLGSLPPKGREILAQKLGEIADLRLQVGASDEAIMLLRQASKIHETAETHRRLAKVYERRDELSKARWHSKRATKLDAGG